MSSSVEGHLGEQLWQRRVPPLIKKKLSSGGSFTHTDSNHPAMPRSSLSLPRPMPHPGEPRFLTSPAVHPFKKEEQRKQWHQPKQQTRKMRNTKTRTRTRIKRTQTTHKKENKNTEQDLQFLSRSRSQPSHTPSDSTTVANYLRLLLLMAEILHHLGCMKPYK